MWVGSAPEGTLLSSFLLIFLKSFQVAAQPWKWFPLLINSSTLWMEPHMDFAKSAFSESDLCLPFISSGSLPSQKPLCWREQPQVNVTQFVKETLSMQLSLIYPNLLWESAFSDFSGAWQGVPSNRSLSQQCDFAESYQIYMQPSYIGAGTERGAKLCCSAELSRTRKQKLKWLIGWRFLQMIPKLKH